MIAILNITLQISESYTESKNILLLERLYFWQIYLLAKRLSVTLLAQVLPYTARKYLSSPLASLTQMSRRILGVRTSHGWTRRARAYSNRTEYLSRSDDTPFFLSLSLSSDGRRKNSFRIARYMQPVFPKRMSRRRRTCESLPFFAPRLLYQGSRFM